MLSIHALADALRLLPWVGFWTALDERRRLPTADGSEERREERAEIRPVQSLYRSSPASPGSSVICDLFHGQCLRWHEPHRPSRAAWCVPGFPVHGRCMADPDR